MYQMVQEFYQVFGVDVTLDTRMEMIKDEVYELELEFATYPKEDLSDPCTYRPALAKEALDCMYHLIGLFVEMEVDPLPLFREVHRSNMSKVNPDGTIRKAGNGKILKGKNYSLADLSHLAEGQITC